MSEYESDAEAVVRILRTVRLRDLMGSDGCLCGWTLLRGYQIDRSCHKSERPGGSLRVVVPRDCEFLTDLAAVAAEAFQQMRSEAEWPDILVRYCGSEDDAAGDGWVDGVYVYGTGRCVYCHAPRESRDAYLCSKHAADPGIAKRYAYETLPIHGVQVGTRE